MADILTPLQALVALLGECELTLDYRPKFRRAMADAATAIANAHTIPSTALHGTITLGGQDDEPELTFAELFGEPDRSAVDPQVLTFARAEEMA